MTTGAIIHDMKRVTDAMGVLSSVGAADQIRKLLTYHEAFHALVGWKVGDYAVLTRDQNERRASAWNGVACLSAGSVGRIVEVDWDSHAKRVSLLWEPAIEPSSALRCEPRGSYDTPKGSVERLYPGGVTNRNYPDVDTRKAMQVRIDAFARSGYVPYVVNSPDRPHCYSMWLEDVAHAIDVDVERATGIMVKCLRCGEISQYADLPVNVYEHPGGKRPMRLGEEACLPYKHCPHCVEEQGLIVLNPPWPMVTP